MTDLIRQEVVEHLNENYSTLDVDEAKHFTNKHYDSIEGTVEEMSNLIAVKENLVEIIK